MASERVTGIKSESVPTFVGISSNWKRSAAGLLIFLLGLWFNLTGQQIQIRLGRHRVTQTFQTEFRIHRLLRQHGMSVYRVVREPEFVIYIKRF